ncbi:MAG: DoxX family protein [Deltaproteobacteria bacterium]
MSYLNDLGLFVLRVSISATMILAHGLSKLLNPAPFIEGLAVKGYPVPAVLGYAAISAETLFPLLIILGLFTRVSALIAAGNMLVAGLVHHVVLGGDPFNVWERALLYMIVFLTILITGPGGWSVGRLFGGRP